METTKIAITKEIHNGLVKTFESRAQAQGLKGKKKLNAQVEFFLGAVALLDILNDAVKTGESSITPAIYFSLLRGDEIKEIK